MLEKLTDLDSAAHKGIWTEDHTVQYEKLDTIVTDSMRCAEKAAARKISSTFCWSITLAQAMQACRYWQLRPPAFQTMLHPHNLYPPYSNY